MAKYCVCWHAGQPYYSEIVPHAPGSFRITSAILYLCHALILCLYFQDLSSDPVFIQGGVSRLDLHQGKLGKIENPTLTTIKAEN